MKAIHAALALLLALSPGVPARGQDAAPDLGALWQDPEFQKRFLGSYGIHPDVEPRLSPEERTVLEGILPLMGSDRDAAERQLRTFTTPESTALFDFTLGNLALQADRVDEAGEHYRAAVRKFPEFRRAHRNLGLVLMREGQYPGALRALTRVVELGGEEALIYGLMGFAHTATGDLLAAETSYRAALLLQPDGLDHRLGLVRVVLKQEKYEEAVALLDALLEREPERPELWLLQANAFIGLKQPARASENLEIVARMGKASTETLHLLGDIYINEGQPELAVSAYTRALAQEPGQSPARTLRAVEALAARGSPSGARLLSERLRTAAGDNLSAEDDRRLLALEARLALAEGNGPEAVRILEEVVARNPLDGDALMLIGDHYVRAGEKEKGLIYLERAATLEPFEAAADVRRARVLVSQSRYEDAVPLLKRAQELAPQDDVARYLEQVERAARARR